ncbi:type 4a pilus biogenesis protein PilO [Desulfobulbus rhabdoformis]|jgi:Tfp pilus assembly protein PilO|uniref:type 4a pilus biogenesis protein PilO n=1 Tax=Desulfobulbus rhabdoformis TaxID=34032 RepID=UPI0019645038|nr:type 4a pilus biogenesis protein PilO [Desulfobulbus rhabdoformis]MBM9612855.1 type 4a pilus biogenesis protein PilO [Desulfobulbus rhabdoformis]
MKKLTKLESFGLIAAILVSGSYFYMKKVYDPEAKALKKTISRLNKKIGAYNRLQEPPNPAGLKRRLERQHDEEKKMAAALHAAGGRTDAESEVTEILAEISLMAQHENMQVLKLIPKETEVTDVYKWKKVDLQLRGQFYDFVVLIERLKQMTRPLELRQLRIELDQGEYDEVLITATLRV